MMGYPAVGRPWKKISVLSEYNKSRKTDVLLHAASFRVSWIDVVPFGWLGASGLGPRFVAKLVTCSYAKAV